MPEHFLEECDGFAPVAIAVAFQTLCAQRDDRLIDTRLVCLQTEQLIDEHMKTSSLYHNIVDRTGHDIEGGKLVR
jgi:hypothetical protein